METNNIIFTIVIVIFIVLFAGASYFVLNDKVLSDNANNSNNTLKFETGNSNEVFHLRDNIYSYNEAKAACKAYNARLASINEVIDA